jgi:Ca-activated chloride channel homolog
MRTTLALAASVAACATILAIVPVRAAQRTFRSGVDLVTLGAAVFDKKGNHLTDLRQDDFEIYEDGQKQAVQLFAPCDAQAGEPGPASPVELHLGALLDFSESMEADLQFEQGAAIKFLGSRPEARDLTLVAFETEIRVSRYTQSEFGRLVERIRGRQTEGATALWDAIGVYLGDASKQEGRKVLVLYTDGGENVSSLRYNELLDLLKASDVTVHAIGLVQHQRPEVLLELRTRLQRIAEITGGQAFFPVSMRDLDRAYAQVAAEIDAQYSIGYVSTNAKTDGTWRKVEIRVVRPGLAGVKVRARAGYYAPKRPQARGPEA